MAKRTGILVVAYNAEATLHATLARIPAAVARRVEEIFVFDDCSQDKTWEAANGFAKRAHAPEVTVHRNPVNLQYGGNQKQGLWYARERGMEIVDLLHGDGQYAPEVMEQLLEPLDADEADLVMGSRMLAQGAARRGGMPFYKYVGNRVLSRIQNWLLRTRFSEFHSGYRAYSMRALNAIDLTGLTDSWHFDTQIILELLRRGYRISEVPIPTYYGDEICHVSGIPYAYQCLTATLGFALRRHRAAVPVPSAQRSSE